MLLPSRRNAIFYKIDVFEKSTKMTSQNTPKTPPKSTKNQEKNDHENKSGLETPILFRSFPIFLNLFRSFLIFGPKNPFGSPILCHPPQTCSAKAGPKSAGRTILPMIAIFAQRKKIWICEHYLLLRTTRV